VSARDAILEERRTLGIFVLMVLLVGLNGVAIRFSNRELDPFWNAGFRFVLAAMLFAGWALIRRSPRPARRAVLGGLVYGLLAFAGFFGFLYLGFVHVTAGLGQTILALGPLLTLFMAAAIGLERLHWRPIAGSLLSLIGLAVAFGAVAALDVPPTSILAMVVAATSFAAAGIVAKRFPPSDPVMQNLVGSAVGGVILLALSAALGERWVLPTLPATWVAFLYLVVGGTFVVFLLFLHLLRRWPASRVSYQFVLAPVVSLTAGAVLLGEGVGPGVVAGVALVMVGVWVGALSRTR
jgi:drug/metabolite transporter (DMT)-like permease